MVKPREHDVVFMEGGDEEVDKDEGAVAHTEAAAAALTPQHSTSNNASSSSPPSSETSGNRIYKGLLRDFYEEYFETSDPLEQRRIRRLLLQTFQERISTLPTLPSSASFSFSPTQASPVHRRLLASPEITAKTTEPNSPTSANATASANATTKPSTPGSATATAISPPPQNSSSSSSNKRNKPQFLEYRKQGNTFCFTKVFFKHNIDQKIKESFERMRQDHGDSGGNPEDRSPVKVTATAATPTTTTASAPPTENANSNLDSHRPMVADADGDVPKRKNSFQSTTSSSPSPKAASSQEPDTVAPKQMTPTPNEVTATAKATTATSPAQSHQGGESEQKSKEQANSKTTANSKASDSVKSNTAADSEQSESALSLGERPSIEADTVGAVEAEEATSIQVSTSPGTQPHQWEESKVLPADGASSGNASNIPENQNKDPDKNAREGAPRVEHQTAGCVTGEGEHSRNLNDNTASTSPPNSSPSFRESLLAMSVLRKRTMNFLWKDTSTSEAPPKKKARVQDERKTLFPAPQSNWGILRDRLFRLQVQLPSFSGRTDSTNAPGVPAEAQRSGSNGEGIGEDGGLEAMAEILVSPYEGNRSAEVGEEPLDKWKNLMKAIKTDGNTAKMNPLLSNLYGDPLAITIFQARLEIAKMGPLYENSWKRGEIGSLSLGWIPKKQLLLCLSEEKFASQPPATPATKTPPIVSRTKECETDGSQIQDDDCESDEDSDDCGEGETEALQKVARKLDCFELVIAAMKNWNLQYDYPELYSNKEGGEFVFRKQHSSDEEDPQPSECNTNEDQAKRNCYKCLIFVARVHVALLLFNQEHKVTPSLMGKVKACLDIINKHTDVHPAELAKLLKRKRRMESNDGAEPSQRPKRKKKKFRRSIEGTCEEREATLSASLALIQKEYDTLLKMMEYFKTRLTLVKEKEISGNRYSSLETWEDEIASNLEREFAMEERRRKKVARAKQRRMR